MWPGFNPYDGGLHDLVRRAAACEPRVVTSPKVPVDLEICSVFPSRIASAMTLATGVVRRALNSSADFRSAILVTEPSEKAERNVWFTGENIRPPRPDTGWDLTLSFESDQWPGNCYLPLWLLGTDAFGGGSSGFIGNPVRTSVLTNGRPNEPLEVHRRFACAFIRNPEPTRLTVIDALRTIGPVDVYGPITGNPVPSKAETAKNYKFMVCMENDLYPGYVTEKPIEAWASGCIPLWWGLDRDGNLNPDSMVNLASYRGLEGFLDQVAALESNSTLFEETWRRPLITNLPNVNDLITRLRDVL